MQIKEKLSQGDRRQIIGVNDVLEFLQDNPNKFNQVFELIKDDNPLVKMRASDIVEKFSKNNYAVLIGYEDKIISLLNIETQQEILWHLAEIIIRLKLNKAQKVKAIKLLKKHLNHKSKIVQTFMLDSLTKINPTKETLKLIQAKIKTGSPAVSSRAKKLLIYINEIKKW